jgi:hypothetical protein
MRWARRIACVRETEQTQRAAITWQSNGYATARGEYDPIVATSEWNILGGDFTPKYVGVPISLWLFLFAAQPRVFFLDGLKKLQQQSHKCVELRGRICRVNTFFQSRGLLFSL